MRLGGRARGRGLLVGITAALLAALIAPGPARAQAPGSRFGTGKATAIVAQYVPSVGSLKLAIASGISIAELRNQLAQSQAQTLDLGLIGGTLTAIPCEHDQVAGQEVFGNDPALSPSDLPQPVRVDNRGGETSADETSYPIVPSLVDAGVSHVHATPVPSADALATTGRITVGSLAIGSGRATTMTESLEGGAARVATAQVQSDVDIPGVLHLTGLRWDASHRTGTDPSATGSFQFGSAEVLGQALPVETMPAEDVVAALNATLAPLGITFTAPTVERITEPVDLVRVTPLRMRFGGSLLSSLVIAPILNASRQVKDDLEARLHEEQCRTADAVTVLEIILGQLNGTGSSVVDVGGVEATTAEVEVFNPFGDGGLLSPVPDLAVPSIPVPEPAPIASPALAPAPIASPPAQVAARPIGSFERVCESVHPYHWPSCSSGAAPFVGLAAVAATAAIGFLDWRHQRRRRAGLPAVGGPAGPA